MKRTFVFVAAAAVLATACNAEKNNGTSGTATSAAVVKPPKGGDWTQLVSATEAGGFLMGNPNAAVKLVEYGSMTCPHCREFDERGVPALLANYVKKGQVSWEFRNYVRDPYDLAGALVTRCNGAKTFFPLTRAMYADQDNWIKKLQAIPEADMQKLQDLPPEQQFLTIAKYAGFIDWAAQRGLAPAKTTACLQNTGEVDKLVQMNSDTTTQFPDFAGTPGFVVNGKLVEGATWEALEPELKKALGG